MSRKYKPIQSGRCISENEIRLSKISQQGDPLERLNKVINWNLFLPPRKIIRQSLSGSWS